MTFESYFQSLTDKKVAVVGAGISNLPLIDLLLNYGVKPVVCDKRTESELGDIYTRYESMGVSFNLGAGYLKNIGADVIFRTPGLHPRFLGESANEGTVITSEMELFFRFCPCKTVAVTGSDGKTTTSTLIAKMLEADGRRVFLGGNIGTPLLSKIPEMRPGDFAVLELSSFQLHSMKCKPDVAVITNISPNHLDVHPDYEDYISAKEQIFLAQTEESVLVLNDDDGCTERFRAKARGNIRTFSMKNPAADIYFNGTSICRSGNEFLKASEVLLPGLHNIQNLMTAFCALSGMVSDEAMLCVARTFTGVQHRLEPVRMRRGVKFINDSIASSPTRAIAGLRSFEKPVILIAGGHDKKVPFAPLAEEIITRTKAAFLTGETEYMIAKAIDEVQSDTAKPPITIIDDFREAVIAAAESAQPGDIVLLSPACSSFDKFRNFEERGNYFKQIVTELPD